MRYLPCGKALRRYRLRTSEGMDPEDELRRMEAS